MTPKTIPKPDRLRKIEKPFAWIPFRLLEQGYLANLSDSAKLLYLFLCLAADRQGISYYSDLSIVQHFQFNSLQLARTELQEKDLIAYDGSTYQVLSLPQTIKPAPSCRPQDQRKPDLSPQKAPTSPTTVATAPKTPSPLTPHQSDPQPLAAFLERLKERFC